jgi:hypothetical protein
MPVTISKKRTFNTRLIKQGLSYDVKEIADLFGIHENSVLRWIGNEGLPLIDDTRPYLVHGADLAAFIKKRQAARKKKCSPEEFFCCKCRMPRTAWGNTVDIIIKNKTKLQIRGLCAVCDTAVIKAGAAKKIHEYQKTFVVQTIDRQHINDSELPLVNCDSGKVKNNETIQPKK